MNEKKTIEKNSLYTVEITGMNHEGQGVGRIDGFVIFVENAIVGEVVEVLVIKVTKSYAIGKLVSIAEPSKDRVEPFCKVNKRCGGCSLQHMSYEAQLDFKTQVVVDALKRIGKIENAEEIVRPTLGMESPFRYRNKAPYPCCMKEGNISIGFYAKRSHEIIEHDECEIQDPRSTKIMKLVKEFCVANNIPGYNEKNGKGILRHVVTRIGFNNNEIMVILVINGQKFPQVNSLVEILVQTFPEIKSIYENINTKNTNVILGNRSNLVYGERTIKDSIGNLEFEISPLSFFQVNPRQTEVLYSKAKEFAKLSGNEVLIDLYCGTGTIGLYMADGCGELIGVEVVEPAVRDAIKNAEYNKIDNARFFVGEAENVLPRLVVEGVVPQDKDKVVVVDPPRKGCDKVLVDTVTTLKPNRIVYVSCAPATLARDLVQFAEGGYEIKEVQPVDMFSWTPHVETVVLLSRKAQ